MGLLGHLHHPVDFFLHQLVFVPEFGGLPGLLLHLLQGGHLLLRFVFPFAASGRGALLGGSRSRVAFFQSLGAFGVLVGRTGPAGAAFLVIHVSFFLPVLLCILVLRFLFARSGVLVAHAGIGLAQWQQAAVVFFKSGRVSGEGDALEVVPAENPDLGLVMVLDHQVAGPVADILADRLGLALVGMLEQDADHFQSQILFQLDLL